MAKGIVEGSIHGKVLEINKARTQVLVLLDEGGLDAVLATLAGFSDLPYFLCSFGKADVFTGLPGIRAEITTGNISVGQSETVEWRGERFTVRCDS